MARGKMPLGTRGKMARRNERLLERIKERAETLDDRLARAVSAAIPAEPAPIPAAPKREQARGVAYESFAYEGASEDTRQLAAAFTILDQVDRLAQSTGLYDINASKPVTRDEVADSFRQWVNEDDRRQIRFLDGDTLLARDFFVALKASYDRELASLAFEVAKGKKGIQEFRDAMDRYNFEPGSVLEQRQAAAKPPAVAPTGKRRYDLD